MKPEGIGRGTGVFLSLLSPCCSTLECKGHFGPQEHPNGQGQQATTQLQQKGAFGPASLALQGRKYYLNVE